MHTDDYARLRPPPARPFTTDYESLTMNTGYHQTSLSHLLSGNGLASGNKDVLKAICIALAEDAQSAGAFYPSCSKQPQIDKSGSNNRD